jgi:hypothetical protein
VKFRVLRAGFEISIAAQTESTVRGGINYRF